jgi:hypothetical protein
MSFERKRVTKNAEFTPIAVDAGLQTKENAPF